MPTHRRMKADAGRPSVLLLVVTGILCTLVVVVFARLAYGLVLPAMREDLNLSYSSAANLGTITALGYLSFVMVAGMVAARRGPRLSILMGLAMAVLGFLGLSLASSYILLMLLMALLGLATAFAYTPLISLVGAWYPEKRATIIGWTNSGVGLGMLLTGAMVPWLTARNPYDGWRFAWLIFALAAVCAVVLVFLVLRDPPAVKRSPHTGSASSSLSSVYRNPHVVIIGLLYGIVGITYIVQSIFMYSFMLEAGVEAGTAGRLVALMGFVSIFAGPSWGWAADRIGHAHALLICMTLSLVGTVIPVLWPVTPGFAAHYALMGISITGLFTSILAASTSTVQPAQAPVAVSFVTLFFAFGQLLGPAAAGLVIEWQGSFQLVFALSSAIMVVGIVLSRRSGQAQRRSRDSTLSTSA